MARSLEQIILREKPVKVLAHLKSEETENYGMAISRAIGTTQTHIVNILNRLEERGLITREKKDRKKIISLTEEGERMAEHAKGLMDGIEAVEEKRGSEAQ